MNPIVIRNIKEDLFILAVVSITTTILVMALITAIGPTLQSKGIVTHKSVDTKAVIDHGIVSIDEYYYLYGRGKLVDWYVEVDKDTYDNTSEGDAIYYKQVEKK